SILQIPLQQLPFIICGWAGKQRIYCSIDEHLRILDLLQAAYKSIPAITEEFLKNLVIVAKQQRLVYPDLKIIGGLFNQFCEIARTAFKILKTLFHFFRLDFRRERFGIAGS